MNPSTLKTKLPPSIQFRKAVFIGCLSLAALLATSLAPADPITYTLENLSTGNLVGQDNWLMPSGHTSPIVGAGTGFDTTKVGKYGGAGVLPAYRPNDGNFSFGVFADAATSASIEFDARHADLTAGSTERFYVFYNNGLGIFSTSPWIGLNGGNFELRGANGGTVTTAGLAAGVDVGDWVRLRLLMDFTDTTGGRSGSMDASYLNLTDGQSSFTPIAGLQDINMQLNRNQSLPSTWNALAVRLDVSTGTGRQFDNLTIHVPEPGSGVLLLAAALLAAAAGGHGAMRRRRGRARL